MPKVKLSDYDQQTQDIEFCFRKAMVGRYKQKDLAKKLRISQPMLSKRLADIDNVKLGDLREMGKYLGIEIIIRGKTDEH